MPGRCPNRPARTSTPSSATRSTRGSPTTRPAHVGQAEHTGQAIYGDEALEDFAALDAVSEGGLDGAWDSARRLAELEADGIVGRGDLSRAGAGLDLAVRRRA